MAQNPDLTSILEKWKTGDVHFTRQDVAVVCGFIGQCVDRDQAPGDEILAFAVSAMLQLENYAHERQNGEFRRTSPERTRLHFHYLNSIGLFTRLIQETRRIRDGVMLVPRQENDVDKGTSRTTAIPNSQAISNGSSQTAMHTGSQGIPQSSSQTVNPATSATPQGSSRQKKPALTARIVRVAREPDPKKAEKIPGKGEFDNQGLPLPSQRNKPCTKLALEKIYELAETGDQNLKGRWPELFYTTSQLVGETKPEYAWIYLRKDSEGNYPISEGRLRVLFPEYKLVEQRLEANLRQISHVSQLQYRRDGHWATKSQKEIGASQEPSPTNPLPGIAVSENPLPRSHSLQDSQLITPMNLVKRESSNDSVASQLSQRGRPEQPYNSQRAQLCLHEGFQILSSLQGAAIVPAIDYQISTQPWGPLTEHGSIRRPTATAYVDLQWARIAANNQDQPATALLRVNADTTLLGSNAETAIKIESDSSPEPAVANVNSPNKKRKRVNAAPASPDWDPYED